jgi:hypothetical protein
MSGRTVELETPVGRDWEAVVRMVLGGIGDRLDLGFDAIDDLQLAVERLLAEAAVTPSVRLSFEFLDSHLRTSIGPLAEDAVAHSLQGPEPPPGTLTLRRILSTVVDAYGVERADEKGLYVRLEKRVAA